MSGTCRISFLTDNCVPDSVGNTLVANGHDVTRLRDCMATDTADQVVAIACAASGYVLVTHDKDFKAVAKRLSVTQRQYSRLHRIALKCAEANGAKRIQEALTLIESEWLYAQALAGRNMVIEITEVGIRTNR